MGANEMPQGRQLTETQRIEYDSELEAYFPVIRNNNPVSIRDTQRHFSVQTVKYFSNQGILPYIFDPLRGAVTFAVDESIHPFMDYETFKIRFSDVLGALSPEMKRLLSDDSKISFVQMGSELIKKITPYVVNPELIGNYEAQRKAEREFAEGIVNSKETQQYVDGLITRAIDYRASDIHLECMGGLERRIRFRVDGELIEIPSSMSPSTSRAVITVLKNRCGAGIKIEEHRRPQDGKLSFSSSRVDSNGKPETYDLRAAFCPVIGGEENAILRINPRQVFKDLAELELSPYDSERLGQACRDPNGIVLVTGPTGSGKTTTLYALLNSINQPNIKIVTIEDPVECVMPGLQQTQVLRAVNLDFDSFLSNILRMDPDVVFVGEIRNDQTAAVAIDAAKTGHLVFSSLHTNNAPGAVNRLRGMGISKLELAENLRGVLAQTLVPVYESQLRQRIRGATLTEEDLKLIRYVSGGQILNTLANERIYPEDSLPFVEGEGSCFSGRQPLTEFWLIDDQSQEVIENPNTGISTLSKTAEEAGMRPMFISGVEKVMEGKTSMNHIIDAVGSRVFSRKKDLLRKYILP
jgi:type IV pilus assembly protein PilB